MIKTKDWVVYECENYVIVNKPAGFLTLPDRFDKQKTNVITALKNHYAEVYPVHRLDKETSGILLVARNKEFHREMSMAFEKGLVEKKYWAIVNGTVAQEEAEINLAIGFDPSRPGKMMITKSGKSSVTRYRVLNQYKQCTLLEINLLTGRTHQIRVHMQALGHPLLVDPDYGGKSQVFLSDFKNKKFKITKDTLEMPIMTRVTLHSYSLCYRDERIGVDFNHSVDPPKDFKALLNQLGKWSMP
jgi:23S rRNA pseudouridine1911/1915/1917 synthase